jgi:hypothetical protein
VFVCFVFVCLFVCRQVIRLLQSTTNGKYSYDDILNTVFSGDDVILHSLLRSDAFRVEHIADGKYIILPGSRVFAQAFERLISNEAFAACMDLDVMKAQILKEQNKLLAFETLYRDPNLSLMDSFKQAINNSKYTNDRDSTTQIEALQQIIQQSTSKLSILHTKRMECEQKIKTLATTQTTK